MTTNTQEHLGEHPHKHGPNCGHQTVRHDGHLDYLHEGHLHHMHGDHIDEHVIPVNANSPIRCTPNVQCRGHTHGPGCGHDAIPHGDHIDYVIDGRMHHPHGDHCDDHGALELS
jgi:hypothetical protein